MVSESAAQVVDSADRVVSGRVVSAAPDRGPGPDPVVGEWS